MKFFIYAFVLFLSINTYSYNEYNKYSNYFNEHQEKYDEEDPNSFYIDFSAGYVRRLDDRKPNNAFNLGLAFGIHVLEEFAINVGMDWSHYLGETIKFGDQEFNTGYNMITFTVGGDFILTLQKELELHIVAGGGASYIGNEMASDWFSNLYFGPKLTYKTLSFTIQSQMVDFDTDHIQLYFGLGYYFGN